MRKSDVAPLLHACLVPALGHPHVHAMLPPPAPRAPVWTGIGHLISEAERAIGDLKAYMVAWEYPDMVTRSLARREAVSSSQIEGTRTTLPQLLDYEATQAPGTAPPDAPTTERYVVALDAGLAAVRTGGRAALSAELVQRLHATLMVFEPNCQPGQYRDEQVFIGAGRIEDATFVPCPPDAIAPAMLELERDVLQYAPGEEDTFALPLIVQVAIAHAQFETIHPFVDGNGRTGRILMPLLFASEGLPAIYVSGPLLRHKRSYYDSLQAVQLRGDWVPWITMMCRVAIQACAEARALATELTALVTSYRVCGGFRRKSAAWRLAPKLIGNPSLTANMAAAILDVSHRAALTGLYQLEHIGAVARVDQPGREQLFRASAIIGRLSRP